jgi:hypothetical protein
MGLYDRLILQAACPVCREVAGWSVQYKWGACSLATRQLGDAVPWTGEAHDVGEPGTSVTLVGHPERSCATCGSTPSARIEVEEGVLRSVELLLEPSPRGGR